MEWSAWVYSVDMLLSWHLWGSIQTSFTPRRSCQLHSTLRGTLQVTPLSFAASGLGLERLSKCGKSRHHGTVCFNIFICIYKWSDGMSEIGVVQFLVDVQEHALQPFFKVHFTWGNDWCRLICKGTTLLKLLIFSCQCLILFLPETVSTDIVGCVSIVDESIGSYQISASVSPEKEKKMSQKIMLLKLFSGPILKPLLSLNHLHVQMYKHVFFPGLKIPELPFLIFPKFPTRLLLHNSYKNVRNTHTQHPKCRKRSAYQ